MIWCWNNEKIKKLTTQVKDRDDLKYLVLFGQRSFERVSRDPLEGLYNEGL